MDNKPQSPQSPVILLVEDDPLLIKMYSTKFLREGFIVKNAGDGEEGLRVATEEKVDFMIVDVMMPKMSGSDMLVKLRQNPKTAGIPAIVLTNLTQQDEAAKLKTLGVKEYLIKADLTPSEVVNKVKAYLQAP
ncbi:MAG: PAS/PAC sensor hybrid histidine kinase [Candidatus Woesebacteria bacterium GW2011_GWB1_38_5b]|uniref:PAS/PAC sensor hybrid histidine kinase n=1 Tax=Candidatus Woesebacteria bacterium GW2011_GWB1_38_5b TaxID=1618569 RepID=A0A0G0K270_9BACT|nr:MAG: PAS/PAC sensor hybrid histidine kinase [Candidatus Woesebacteria bacterium GW2011_GWB1_38_5b]